jgi:subtilisin family serine protease
MHIRNLLLVSALAGIASTASAQAPTAQADGSLGKIANQYICTFGSSVSRANVRAEADKATGQSLGQILHVYRSAIKGFAVRMPAVPGNRSQMAELKANNPKIASCEQDQEVKAFAKPPGGGTPPPQATDWGVTRVGGPGTPVSGRTAWVIDTGVDLDHPELNVNVSLSRSFVRDSSPDDFNGHGSHVAGTIAARNNSIGVVGVAPGAPVVSVRVLDRGGRGTNSGVIAGVDYVAETANSGDVANMSLGGGPSDALDNAVINAAAQGIKFTLAAGNESDDANNHSPARANGPNVYTLSAFANGGGFASFSNYGNPPVDYAEPGVSIRSTYKNGGYAILSGTSMAAPHLAGILMTGSVHSGGTVSGDPDGEADTIGVR